MKYAKLVLACCLVTTVAVAAAAQGRDDYSVIFVRNYLKMASSGVLLGSEQRQMWRQGDRVAVALLKIYGPEELRDPKVVRPFLPAIHTAFENPKWIELDVDRKPSVTLFLLGTLRDSAQDQELKGEISQLIEFVRKQSTAMPKQQ